MKKIMCCTWLAFAFALFNTLFCQQDFTGHKVIGVVPQNPAQVAVLRKFMDDPEVDFWVEPTRIKENVTVHLPPRKAEKVEVTLRTVGLDFYTITDNLQTWIDREKEENDPGERLAGRTASFAFDVYHPLDDITAYLDDVKKKHTNLTQLIPLGTTFEGNVIHVVKEIEELQTLNRVPKNRSFPVFHEARIRAQKMISSGGNDTRPAVWIDAGIHSREWIAPATALYIINHLLTNYGTNKRITTLVDTYDWYIMPLVNPDGYLHTWTWNRLWRKNRAIAYNFPGVLICRGTDPNRNFDIKFGGPSTSSTPCSSIYKGDFPFSEAESAAIRDGVSSIKDRLKAYFTLHSFSQLWMTPHGYTTLAAPDFRDHMEILDVAVSAVEATHGMAYRYGPSAQTLYATSGSASDWVYDVMKVKYSFSVELRDRGVFGFLLPRSQIIPTAEETWYGIEAATLYIIEKELKNKEAEAAEVVVEEKEKTNSTTSPEKTQKP